MIQAYEALLNYPINPASAAALASSAALTDISPLPNFVLPALTLQPGQVYKLTAGGVFSNTGTPTLLLGFYIGAIAGTPIAASGAITTITGATAWSWTMECMFAVRTGGATGTIFPFNGKLFMPASLTQFQAAYALPTAAPAAVTVDMTASKAITVGAQWGTSSASNSIQCHHFAIESVA